MARAFVLAIVLLGGGLACEVGPAAAASCEDICLKGRCSPGNVSYSQATCMSKCVPACEALRQGKK